MIAPDYWDLSLVHSGRHEEAIGWLKKSIQLDPFQPASALEFLGEAHFFLHRYGEALETFYRIIEPPYWVIAFTASCYALMGNDSEMRKQRDAYDRDMARVFGEQYRREREADYWRLDIRAYARSEDRALYADGLIKTGILPADFVL